MSDEKGPELFKIADRIKADYEARGVEVPYYWIHKKSGVAYNTVVRFFNGEGYPRMDTVRRITDALGYNIDDLLRNDDKYEYTMLSPRLEGLFRKISILSEEELRAIEILTEGIWYKHMYE